MLRRIAGLIGLIAGAIMFVTLIPQIVTQFDQAFASSSDLWDQIQAVISALWSLVYQPLVLVLLGLIALTGK